MSKLQQSHEHSCYYQNELHADSTLRLTLTTLRLLWTYCALHTWTWRGGGISGCKFGIVCGCNGAGDWIMFSSDVEGAGTSVSAIDCCSFSGEFLDSTFTGGWIGSLALMGVDDAMSKSIGFFVSLKIWRILSCLRARSWKIKTNEYRFWFAKLR